MSYADRLSCCAARQCRATNDARYVTGESVSLVRLILLQVSAPLVGPYRPMGISPDVDKKVLFTCHLQKTVPSAGSATRQFRQASHQTIA